MARYNTNMDYSPDRMNDALQLEKRFRDFFASVQERLKRIQGNNNTNTKSGIDDSRKKWGEEESKLYQMYVTDYSINPINQSFFVLITFSSPSNIIILNIGFIPYKTICWNHWKMILIPLQLSIIYSLFSRLPIPTFKVLLLLLHILNHPKYYSLSLATLNPYWERLG